MAMNWSVVIVAKDLWNVTKVCLDTLVATMGCKPEIVYVDNGSESIESIKGFADWSNNYGTDLTKQIIIPSRSVEFCGGPVVFGAGISRAWNLGIKETTGDYVLVINNDLVFLRPGWLEQFEGALHNQLIGLVGMTGMSWRTVHFIQGSIFAFRKSTYEFVGPFDEWIEFSVEEVDYCLRVRNKGMYIQAFDEMKNVFVQHIDSVTRRSGDQRRQWFIQYKAHESRLRFCYKWPELGSPSLND